MAFLPTTAAEMKEAGLDQVDFVYVSGDAYVDHPSFGCAIITRTLETFGYTCAILSQPDWNNDEEFLQFGTPRLGFLVSAGNIDSMVNHYSVNKRRRDKDNYTDEGVMGKRPDRATIVYSQVLKRLFPDVPVLIGGIEASLRRLAHYDYWDDKVRRSILMDSQADLLMFGMGENTIIEVADALASGMDVKDICYIRGTAWKTKSLDTIFDDYIVLPSYNEVKTNKKSYAKSFMTQYENQDAINARMLVEPYDGWYVVVNQSPLPLTQEQMDFTYALPYERTFHPKYKYVPRHRGSAVFHHEQPRLLWQLHVLRHHEPPGSRHFHPQHRKRRGGGEANHPDEKLQRVHPRRRRSERQLLAPGVRQASRARRVSEKAVLVAQTMQKHESRPFPLRGDAGRGPGVAERQKGVHPLGHSLRLFDVR